jgi:hypothetical protein
MEHTEYICKGGHNYPNCQFCDGGLFACTVCNGAEGSLPTDCPGKKMTEEQSNAIYAGTLDYREGRGWVTPHGTGKSMGDIQTCTRLAPHVCRSNGPCNGWPKPREIPTGATICAHMVEPYDCCICFPRDIKRCRYGTDCPEHGHIWRALETH